MFGYTDNKGDFGGGRRRLQAASETIGTLYVGYGDGPWYVGATVGAGDLDYQRRPSQHPARRR